MPFGLKGAPTTFQRLMDVILVGMKDFSSAYIDDISVFSETWTDHLQHLRQVLETLYKEGLKAKKKKCKFAMTQCSHLGHVVGQGRVEPEQTKVEAVREFAKPRTKKDVRAFLGLLSMVPTRFRCQDSMFIILTQYSTYTPLRWSRKGWSKSGLCKTGGLVSSSLRLTNACWCSSFH